MKAVLITGAAKRIGKVIALEFAHAGYDIALHYHRSEAEAQVTQTEIEALGRRCVPLQQDLTQLEALPELIAQARAAFPALSVLVNNASTFRRISFADTTPQSLAEDFTANFAQAFFLTQTFASSLNQGVVVNLLDAAIQTQRTTHFAYLLAKKTLAEFTLMAANALAPAIRVNAVAPGLVLPAAGETLTPTTTPQQVASAVRMLAENAALTGRILYIDGEREKDGN